MKANRHNRGSVLMEFLIVVPVYIVIFGGLFMIGAMAIKTTRLASAERTRALDVAAGDSPNTNADFGWNAIKDLLFPPVPGDEEDNVSDDPEPYRYHEQGESFQGPWTVAVGSKIKDEYKLASWTRGWLAFAHWLFQDATRTEDELDAEDNVMLPLLNGNSADMFSKNIHKPRIYNYYTYRRTRDYTDNELGKMYRQMPQELKDAGKLVDAAAASALWKECVEKEKYPKLEDAGGENGNKRSAVSLGLTQREYRRYGQFERWSD